jgi:hypothetical protein
LGNSYLALPYIKRKFVNKEKVIKRENRLSRNRKTTASARVATG